MHMKGELRVSFPPNLADALLSFHEMPEFDMRIESDVSLGSVPMPLQRGASAVIRSAMGRWLISHAVAPRAIRVCSTTNGAATAASPPNATQLGPTPTLPSRGSAGEHGRTSLQPEVNKELDDEDLKRAILSALLKHDRQPTRGSRGFRWGKGLGSN